MSDMSNKKENSERNLGDKDDCFLKAKYYFYLQICQMVLLLRRNAILKNP